MKLNFDFSTEIHEKPLEIRKLPYIMKSTGPLFQFPTNETDPPNPKGRNCSSDYLAFRKTVPIFSGNCKQFFSSSPTVIFPSLAYLFNQTAEHTLEISKKRKKIQFLREDPVSEKRSSF